MLKVFHFLGQTLAICIDYRKFATPIVDTHSVDKCRRTRLRLLAIADQHKGGSQSSICRREQAFAAVRYPWRVAWVGGYPGS